MAEPLLSKSKYLAGLQCLKRLWLQTNQPKLAIYDEATKARFEMGTQIGELARRVFPNGAFINEKPWEHDKAESRTSRAIKGGINVIFEGAFTFEGIRIRADILERVAQNDWHLIEGLLAAQRESCREIPLL